MNNDYYYYRKPLCQCLPRTCCSNENILQDHLNTLMLYTFSYNSFAVALTDISEKPVSKQEDDLVKVASSLAVFSSPHPAGWKHTHTLQTLISYMSV